MEFEWDPNKAETNRIKYGVSFPEALSVFGDPGAATFADSKHSSQEERFLTFGHDEGGRLLVVSHTDRVGKIRLISSRRATLKEMASYEGKSDR